MKRTSLFRAGKFVYHLIFILTCIIKKQKKLKFSIIFFQSFNGFSKSSVSKSAPKTSRKQLFSLSSILKMVVLLYQKHKRIFKKSFVIFKNLKIIKCLCSTIGFLQIFLHVYSRNLDLTKNNIMKTFLT